MIKVFCDACGVDTTDNNKTFSYPMSMGDLPKGLSEAQLAELSNQYTTVHLCPFCFNDVMGVAIEELQSIQPNRGL